MATHSGQCLPAIVFVEPKCWGSAGAWGSNVSLLPNRREHYYWPHFSRFWSLVSLQLLCCFRDCFLLWQIRYMLKKANTWHFIYVYYFMRVLPRTVTDIAGLELCSCCCRTVFLSQTVHPCVHHLFSHDAAKGIVFFVPYMRELPKWALSGSLLCYYLVAYWLK